MKHRDSVLAMVGVTLLWSTAGVVTRHLEVARAFEVTFWRSFFNGAFMLVALSLWRGRALWRTLATGGWALWVSGCMWAVMYTCFMVALTLTSVANVLVTMALGPLITALIARLALRHRLPARTWTAIVVAGVGIGWMYGQEFAVADARSLAGLAVALGVPLAAAINWTVLQHSSRHAAGPQDMLPAVLIGAVLSSLASLPLAWPFQASMHDLVLLAGLGVFQLAIPCLLAVQIVRVLPAAEAALLGLLEVVFGVAWAWMGAGEALSPAVLVGGSLVLGALALNEWLGFLQRRGSSPLPVA